MRRLPSALAALVLASGACDLPDGMIGAPCKTNDDCMDGLICDIHEGRGSCQAPHEHEHHDESSTGVPSGTDDDETGHPHDTDHGETSSSTSDDETATGTTEAEAGSTSDGTSGIT